MQNKTLHIVSFDVPYPPDYGGAIDVFYKIKALHQQGVKIHLHCYEYGRGQASELDQYCEKVWYYKRTTGLQGISMSMPYIVSSRRDPQLLDRLTTVDAPILFEGVHTTFFLNHPLLASKFKAVRIHNIEHEYYAQLRNKEKSLPRKLYFGVEGRLLKKYESQLQAAQAFYALSLEDNKHFHSLYPSHKNVFIPPFHQYDEVTSKEGMGNYCLYHGNLSHPENREAALYLLNEIVPHANMPFIIAGRDPGEDIKAACSQLSNCTLIANPSKTKMDELVADAHIHVLPTFQQSGMKLKLLSALYGGRHVVVNDSMLYGTGMPATIGHVANSSNKMTEAIKSLAGLPFTDTDISGRIGLLTPYGNRGNAEKLCAAMFG